MRALAIVFLWAWIVSNIGVQTYVLTWPYVPALAKAMAAVAMVATVIAGMGIWLWIERTF